jgi:hypothetical protein
LGASIITSPTVAPGGGLERQARLGRVALGEGGAGDKGESGGERRTTISGLGHQESSVSRFMPLFVPQ